MKGRFGVLGYYQVLVPAAFVALVWLSAKTRLDYPRARLFLVVPPSLIGSFAPRPVVAADPYVVVKRLD